MLRRNKMSKQVIGVTCLAIMLASCASGKIEEAKLLASAGLNTSEKLLEASKILQQNHQLGLRQQEFLPVFNSGYVVIDKNYNGCYEGGNIKRSKIPLRVDGNNDSEKEKENLKNIDDINKYYKFRVDLSSELSKVYRGFSELAAYDNSNNVEKSSSDIAKLVMEFGANQNVPLVNAKPADLIGVGLNALTDSVQARKLRESSVAIRGALENYQKILVDRREVIIARSEINIGDHYNIMIMLWRRGLVNALDRINDITAISKTQFVYDKKFTANAKEEGLCRVVLKDLEIEKNSKQAMVSIEYDRLIALVKEMIDMHKAFEADAKFDVTRLLAIAEKLGQ